MESIMGWIIGIHFYAAIASMVALGVVSAWQVVSGIIKH